MGHPDDRPTRRCFLKWSLIVGSSLSALPAGIFGEDLGPGAAIGGVIGAGRSSSLDAQAGTRILRVGCPSHNCGGRCLLKLHVENGVIVRIETDDRPTDTVEAPQLRACIRGRAYRRRQYHPDRLLHPLKRVGTTRRGPVRADLVGRGARHGRGRAACASRRPTATPRSSCPTAPAATARPTAARSPQRLLNLFGGSLGHYNNYSWAAMARATETVYGTTVTGNQRQDWLNAKYILMWGWNPSEMRDGTNTEFFLRKAREKGARIVCIDPRMTLSAVALADEWVPIRPGTDAAMMSAMAHVMITVGPARRGVRRRPLRRLRPVADAGRGARAPRATRTTSSARATRCRRRRRGPSGSPASRATTIERLAREYATRKPGVLYQGYGMQRRAYGEQVVRAGCVLAALTGNVGVPGGWAGGLALQAPAGGPLWNVFPTGENPVKASIPTFLWTEAVVRGQGARARARRPRRDAPRQRHQARSTPSPRTRSSTSTPTSTARRSCCRTSASSSSSSSRTTS